jgi:O-antigen ligase
MTAALFLVWAPPPELAHRVPVFNHVRHLGLSIGFMVAVLCVPAPGVARPALQILIRVARIAGFAMVAWSGTRSAMLGVLVAVAVVCLASRTGRIALIADLVIGIGLSTLFEPQDATKGLLNAVTRTSSTGSLDQVSSMRLSMWVTTVQAMIEHGRLWTGLGGNGFMSLQVHLGGQVVPPDHIQPHNFLIQALSDWGVVGLALVAALIACIGKTVQRCEKSAMLAIGLSGAAYIIVSGQLDATMYHLEHLIYFAVSLGIAASATVFCSPPHYHTMSVSNIRIILAGLTIVHLMSLDHRNAIAWYFPTNCRPGFMQMPCHSMGLVIR